MIIKESAGCIIIYQDKMLLCRPTNQNCIKSYTPPKGGIELYETPLQAALRETKEEIGIDIDKSIIENLNNPIVINYYRESKVFKKVYLYIIHLNDLLDIGLNSLIVPKYQLQMEEIEWAGFLNKNEIKNKISHRFKSLIKLI